MEMFDIGPSINRRKFLATSAVSAASLSAGVPSLLSALDSRTRQWMASFSAGDGTLRDPRVKALVASALEAATSAGAKFADARVSYQRFRVIQSVGDGPSDQLRVGFSVRALVDGYWGCAATSTLTSDEAVRIGKTATRSAQMLVKHGRPRELEWLPTPVVIGEWTSPIEVDPFNVPPRDISSLLEGAREYSKLIPGTGWNLYGELQARFERQERVFASTEGSYILKTLYYTGSSATLHYRALNAPLRSLGTAQAGWEYIRDQPFRTIIPSLIAEMKEEAKLPVQPAVDIGRYDVVFGAEAMNSLLSTTVGQATKLGRAIGYDANTIGTSYLGPKILSLLGTSVASPLLTITANRSRPQALATVKWDEEGVVPEDFTLIKDGVLVDYQTTREQAPWVNEWYAKQGRTVRSHGCADGNEALDIVQQFTPNLAMNPGANTASFDDLIAGMEKGLAVKTMGVATDFQCLNGVAGPREYYEVRGGKRVARIDIGSPQANAFLFRTPELLKNILAIGGANSMKWGEAIGDRRDRFSIGTVPVAVKQLTVIDPSRRA